jgi:hypothetical protein
VTRIKGIEGELGTTAAFAVPANFVTNFVVPANFVIPAKAGIHRRGTQRGADGFLLSQE